MKNQHQDGLNNNGGPVRSCDEIFPVKPDNGEAHVNAGHYAKLGIDELGPHPDRHDAHDADRAGGQRQRCPNQDWIEHLH